VPIPVAFVRTPPMLLRSGPLPIIGMNLQLELGLKVRPFSVPAVATVVAHDLSGGSGSGQGQGVRGYENCFGKCVLSSVAALSAGRNADVTPKLDSEITYAGHEFCGIADSGSGVGIVGSGILSGFAVVVCSGGDYLKKLAFFGSCWCRLRDQPAQATVETKMFERDVRVARERNERISWQRHSILPGRGTVWGVRPAQSYR
jgi:hypothetical protein